MVSQILLFTCLRVSAISITSSRTIIVIITPFRWKIVKISYLQWVHWHTVHAKQKHSEKRKQQQQEQHTQSLF